MEISRIALAALIIATSLLARPAAAGTNVKGLVSDVDGNPLGGVTVTAYSSSGAVADSTVTDSRGLFTLALAPGTYTVRLSKGGYVDKAITVTVPKEVVFEIDLGAIPMEQSITVALPYQSISLPALSQASIQLSIANRGSSQETIRVEVVHSCDADVDLYAGSVRVRSVSLSPGQSQSLTLAISTTYEQSGTCLARLVFATRYYNITRELAVNVYPSPLNLVTAQFTSIKSTPGSIIQLPIQVVNRLQQEFTANLELGLPQGWSGSITSTSGLAVSQVYLAPSASLALTLTVEIPEGAAPGDYSVEVRLVGVNPRFEDSLGIGVTVASGKPRIRLELQAPHVDVFSGKTAIFPFKVYNVGDADGLVNFSALDIPSGFTWFVQDGQGNVIKQLYLKAGSSASLALAVTVPPLAEPTIVKFRLAVSAGEYTDERQVSLGVLGKYAVSFVTQNFYLETTPGADATFVVEVQNTGYSAVTNLVLSVARAPSGFTVRVSPSGYIEVKPGETATFTLTVTTDADVDSGDYYVTLTLAGDQIGSSTRDLHVYVKPSGSIAYVAALVVVILIIGVVIVYRRFGRR